MFDFCFEPKINKVWIGWFLSIFTCMGFIWLVVYLKRKFFYKKNDNNMRGFANLSEIFTYVFATLTNHGIKCLYLALLFFTFQE